MATAPQLAQQLDPNDFMATEAHIVQRLKDALKDVSPQVHVLTAAELAVTKEESQPTPAVHVVWNGFRVLDSRVDGAEAHLEHTWMVVTAVRNVSQLKSGAAARLQAGPLMARAGAALMGFRPPNVASPMALTSAPRAGHW